MYWQQRIFSGRDVPPPEFELDREVVEYVLKHAGAIGYVPLPANIQALAIATINQMESASGQPLFS